MSQIRLSSESLDDESMRLTFFGLSKESFRSNESSSLDSNLLFLFYFFSFLIAYSNESLSSLLDSSLLFLFDFFSSDLLISWVSSNESANAFTLRTLV